MLFELHEVQLFPQSFPVVGDFAFIAAVINLD